MNLEIKSSFPFFLFLISFFQFALLPLPVRAYDFDEYRPPVDYSSKQCYEMNNKDFACTFQFFESGRMEFVNVAYISPPWLTDPVEEFTFSQVFSRGDSRVVLDEGRIESVGSVISNVISDSDACALVDYTFDFAGISGSGDCNFKAVEPVDYIKACPKNAAYFPLDQISPLFKRSIRNNSWWEAHRTIGSKQDQALYERPDDVGYEFPKLGVKLWAECDMWLSHNKTSGYIYDMELSVSFMEMNSVEEAQKIGAKFVTSNHKYPEFFFEVGLVEKTSNIGDEGWFYETKSGDVVMRRTLVARSGTKLFGVTFSHGNVEEEKNPRENRARAEELLRAAVGEKSKTAAGFTLSKAIPSTVSAGIPKFDQRLGVVVFSDNKLILRIEGTGLDNVVSVQASTLGMDGKPGIEFSRYESNDQGTVLQVQMNVKPTAKEGVNTVTLSNNQGEVVNFDLNVTITGNQFMNRKFANTLVKFYGEWPVVDERVRYLSNEVQGGVDFMNKGKYKDLKIVLYIFENKYWYETAQYKYCNNGTNNSGFSIGGCSLRHSQQIYLGERTSDSKLSMKSTIVHEAAHKLEAYYNGVYSGRIIGSLLGGFQSKWKGAIGDLSKCLYLPVVNGGWTNEKDPFMPRCGFVMAYGASNLKTYAEDIASFTEILVMNPSVLQKGDGPLDARYKQKKNILYEYDFIQ